MGYMLNTSVELEPEDIIEALNEDGAFAIEFWRVIAERMHQGLLLDNTMDLLTAFDDRELRIIQGVLRIAHGTVKDHLELGD